MTNTPNPLLMSTPKAGNSSRYPKPIIETVSIPNDPSNISQRENYLKSNEYQLTRSCLIEIGYPVNIDDFFAEDLVNDLSFMKTLASFSSIIKSRLHDIDLLCSELVTLIKKCHDCKTSASMNVSLLSRTYLEKLIFIKEIISKIGQIQLKISYIPF